MVRLRAAPSRGPELEGTASLALFDRSWQGVGTVRVAIGSIKGKKGASLPFEFEERSCDFGLLDQTGPGLVCVRGSVMNTGATYYVDALAQAELGLRCDRCLGSVRSVVRTEVRQAFAPTLRPGQAGPRTLRSEGNRGHLDEERETDDELLPVDDDAIDLWPAVRAAVLLAMPMKVLCRSDCRGLCPTCGQERSAGPCGCAAPADPRFLPLRRLVEKVEN